MPTETALPKDDPKVVAWNTYKETNEYAYNRRWAGHKEHVDGSLWAAFRNGWDAANSNRGALRIRFDGPPGPEGPRLIEVEDSTGKSIRSGDWVEDENGQWILVIP